MTEIRGESRGDDLKGFWQVIFSRKHLQFFSMSMDWFQGESELETVDFPVKIMELSCRLPHQSIAARKATPPKPEIRGQRPTHVSDESVDLGWS